MMFYLEVTGSHQLAMLEPLKTVFIHYRELRLQ